MSTSDRIEFKRGDTFWLTGIQLLGPDDQPMPMTDIEIRAQARTATGAKAFSFQVTKHADSYDLDAGNTSSCPIGPLYCDIEYTIPGHLLPGMPSDKSKTQSTEDFVIHCIEDRTR